MSITVSFATSSKRKNSTRQLTMVANHDCTFKNGCSMLNPTLFLELDTSTFPNYTAFKIEDRYYNITDIRSVRNNLFEVSGEVDVLATYKTQILASTQYVSYSSHKSSIWLADTRIPVQKNESVAQAVSTMNFLFTVGGFYVLSVVGKNGCELWICDVNHLHGILDRITDWSDDLIDEVLDGKYPWSNSTAATYDFSSPESAIESMAKMNALTGLAGNAYSDAPNCIRSCIWVPFFASFFTAGSGEIYLGQFPTGVSTFKCTSSPVTRSVTVSIPWQYSDWRRSVCEEVYLYLPLVGMVNIPSDEIINESSLTIEWSATATDGCIAYRVSAGNQVVGTYGANCSVNFPIGVSQQASAGEIVQTAFAGLQKTVSGSIETTSNALTGNISGAISSGVNTGFNAVDAVYQTVNTALTRHNSSIGGIGGGAGTGLSLDCKCFTVAHPTVIPPDDMKNTMGVPTMAPMSLSTLTGYCQCANAHLDIPATDTEKALVDSYLNSGFFIE